VVRKIVHLRWKQRLGPVQIASLSGGAPSTAWRVLARCRLSRLACIDQVTGEPTRHYSHHRPHTGIGRATPSVHLGQQQAAVYGEDGAGDVVVFHQV